MKSLIYSREEIDPQQKGLALSGGLILQLRVEFGASKLALLIIQITAMSVILLIYFD